MTCERSTTGGANSRGDLFVAVVVAFLLMVLVPMAFAEDIKGKLAWSWFVFETDDVVVVLTPRRCVLDDGSTPVEGPMEAIVWRSDRSMGTGCWTMMGDGVVGVRWDTGRFDKGTMQGFRQYLPWEMARP